MWRRWTLKVIFLFFTFSLFSPLLGQHYIKGFKLNVVIQNGEAPKSVTGFRVYCEDEQGKRITADFEPISATSIVSKYNSFSFQSSSPVPFLSSNHFQFDIPFLYFFRGVHLVIEDSDENDGWMISTCRIPVSTFFILSNQFFLPQWLTAETNQFRTIFIHPKKENKIINEYLGCYFEDSAALSMLHNVARLDRRLVERGGWQFEKSWYKVKDIGGSYIQTLYRVRNANQDNWILAVLGEKYENERSVTMMHPDIRDVNFDGVPDLHVSKGNGESDVYFGFNARTERFEELFISRLKELRIDYIQEQVEGYILEYEMGIDEPLAKVNYLFKGPHWSVVQSMKQQYRQPLKVVNPATVSDILYSETCNKFTFELQRIFDFGDLSRNLQRIIIRQEGSATKIVEDSISVSMDSKSIPYFLVVRDFNRDDIPDVYYPKMGLDQSEIVYLSEWADDQLSFKRMEGLSYNDVLMMQGDFSFFSNKMKMQEFDDFNLDGWLDYRVYTQMDKSNGFWSYFIFEEETNSFKYSSNFSMLDYCIVNRKANAIIAWKKLNDANDLVKINYYRVNKGELILAE